MSERYRPKDLKRVAATLWADPNYARSLEQRRRDDIESRRIDRTVSQLRGAACVVECKHGVSWLNCNLCSSTKGRST